jgi:hypothetical protein
MRYPSSLQRCLALLLLLLTTTGASAIRQVQGRYISVTITSRKDCAVTDAPYRAIGDGQTDATRALQRALNDETCGRVIIPAPGTFLTAALALTRSNMELHIEKGAKLLVSNDRERWPGTAHIIQATNISHIAITGAGTVDGQGLDWWRHRFEFRPHMVHFEQVHHAILSKTLYLNAPNHVLEMYCDFCEIAFVRVLAPPSDGNVCENDNTCSHNTDAVDIHGQPFYVHNVNFTTGDDNIAAHANHTLVEDSYFGSGHGASIGSLCNNYLTNITFRNIEFRGTTNGARIKSHPNCSGHVWEVTYKNLTMKNVDTPIELNQYYEGSGPSAYLFERILFTDMYIFGARKTRRKRLPALSSEADVNFDCDDHFDGKANCRVQMENIRFSGYGKRGAKMSCKGVEGTVKNINGIHSCL